MIGRINHEPLIAEVLKHAGRFGDLTFRQEAAGSAHPDSETIYLRMPRRLSLESVFEDMEATEYPAAWEMPETLEAVRQVPWIVARPSMYATVPRFMGRAMIVKLKPGGRIAPHIDEGSYAEATDRYHIPLLTNGQAWHEIGGERVTMGPGEVWFFDKHRVHSGGNDGSTDRIHLIVDLFRC
jgi:quercetin dioxygenase-like cupin family protein